MLIKVGITGGIGAGKSIISKIFSILGVPVYEADKKARYLMENDPDLIQRITLLFGPESYINTTLNREFLSQQVFPDKEKLEQLNKLVHPAVNVDFLNWVSKYDNHKYILKEAALLFETGSYKQLDHTILVSAPEKLRIERVIVRDEFRTLKEVESIIDKQFSESKKKKLASFIIMNNEKSTVVPQVLKIHNQFNQE